MKKIRRRYLYIPMEIFHRELDGNLLLAAHAAKRGGQLFWEVNMICLEELLRQRIIY